MQPLATLKQDEQDALFKELGLGLDVPLPETRGVENRNSISEVMAPIPKLHSVPQRGDHLMTKKQLIQTVQAQRMLARDTQAKIAM